MNVDVLWQNFLEKIKNELSNLAYETWFSDTKLYKLDDGKAIIIVPMEIHKKHIKDNYEDKILNILNEITGTNFDIEYLLEEEITSIENDKIVESSNIEDLPTGIPHISKEQSNLNPNYTFETFIVGNSNKFARTAALSVAENPGKMYNPLFIYGNSGLGKTHLMHAIGNYISDNSNRRVLYVTSNDFINDFIKIQRKNQKDNNLDSMEFFKNKYSDIDVLIIDDIQYLGGANATQQEFFNTFNTLHSDSKQIIISSDRSPNDLNLLADRLKTRFYWGLTVNILPPDYNLKVEILKRKILAANLELNISDEIIDYIASNIGNDVRKLEGAITRLVAYAAIMGNSEVNLEITVDALKDLISNGECEKDDIHRIQKIVAEEFQITVDDIRSKKRSSNISFPRQIAMYLCRMLTTESFPKIGTDFGGKDHSTVMHSVEKIENEIKVNKDLSNIIEKLKKDIGVV